MRLKSRNKFVDAPQRFWGGPVSYCRPCTGGTQRPARKFAGPFDKTARGLANHFSYFDMGSNRADPFLFP
jgi:hypothetical protein